MVSVHCAVQHSGIPEGQGLCDPCKLFFCGIVPPSLECLFCGAEYRWHIHGVSRQRERLWFPDRKTMNDLDPSVLTFERHVTRDPDPSAWAEAQVLVLTACDSGYLGHAIALARSMDEFSGPHHLLIHVVNPGEDDVARLELLAESLQSIRLHISSEEVQLPDAASAA